MKLRIAGLILVPGFALIGAMLGGWAGAAGFVGGWLVFVGVATIVHWLVAHAAPRSERSVDQAATPPQEPRSVPSR